MCSGHVQLSLWDLLYLGPSWRFLPFGFQVLVAVFLDILTSFSLVCVYQIFSYLADMLSLCILTSEFFSNLCGIALLFYVHILIRIVQYL